MHALAIVSLASLMLAATCGDAAALPNGRGYELVSPPDKHGGDVFADTSRSRAAVDGNAMGFGSLTAFADAQGTGIETEYLSLRTGVAGTTGWATHAITPQQGPLAFAGAVSSIGPMFDGDFAPDLSRAVYRSFGAFPNAVNVQNVPNLYLRDDLRLPGTGHYSLLTDATTVQPPPSALNFSKRPWLAGTSADFSHVAFESNLNLTPDAVGGQFKLYESVGGTVRLAGVLPNGVAATRSAAGTGANLGRYTPHTISSDGGRIFFTSGGNVYARIAGAVTVQLNVSEKTAPEAPGGATYWSASTDGTRVFFSTTEGLSDEDENFDNDLYMWQQANHDEVQTVTVNAASGTFTLDFNGEMTQPIAVDASADVVRAALSSLPNVGDGNVEVEGGSGGAYTVRFTGAFAGADVTEMTTDPSGLVGGAATAVVETTVPVENLTRISKDMSGGDAPSVRTLMGVSDDGRYVYFTASGQLVNDAEPLPDGAGIYLWHDGTLTYVGWLTDDTDLGRNSPFTTWSTTYRAASTVRVTPDGERLLFISHSDVGLAGRGGFSRADHGSTCGLDSEALGACRELYLYDATTGRLRCASCHVRGPATGDALTAHRSNTGGTLLTFHLSHALSDDGRYVFFATADPLVQQDVNGKLDVYDYDATTGEQHLLSSGTSSSDSYLLDASASGRDVFFLTRERLVGWDVDDNYDVYDARVGGGMPEPSLAPDECLGDACQAPPTVAAGVTAGSSQLLRGAGDARPTLRTRHRAKRCKHGTHRTMHRGKAKCARKHARSKARSRRAK